MTRETLDKWCERGIFFLVLAILIFSPLALGAVRTKEFLVVQGLTICATALWLIRIWIKPRLAIFLPPVVWPILAFVGYAIYQFFSADIEYAARQELIRVIVYACLFFLVLNNFNRQESARFVAFALFFLALAISAYAIFQFATNSPKVWNFIKPAGYMRRAGGTFINPNHLAGFLEMVLPLALGFVVLGRIHHVTRIVLVYASLLMLVAIGTSISRGGWIVTAITMLGFFSVLIFRSGNRVAAFSMMIGVLLAGGVFATRSWDFQRRFQSVSEESTVRVELWRAAVKIWQSHPWLGVGPGHYDWRFRQYRTPEWWVQTRPIFAHNDYLNTLADWGVVGASIILAGVILLGLGIFKTWPSVQRSRNELNGKGSNRAAFVFGAAFGLFAIALHSFVDFNLQVPSNAILALTLAALLAGFLRFATERFWFSANIWARIPLTILFGAALFYLGETGFKQTKEQLWLQRAQTAETFEGKIAALKNAYEIDPKNEETVSTIGELFRLASWEGNDNYESLAREAMVWFERGMELNRWDPLNFLRYGMCLDWIGQSKKSGAYFEKALSLDPSGYYTVAMQGWHQIQLGNYQRAKPWFEKSLEIYNNYRNRNQFAANYLVIVNEKLAAAPEDGNLPPAIGGQSN